MLPERLQALEKLAYNLWWSWDVGAVRLWESIDPWRWERNGHNPVALVQDVEKDRWTELEADLDFLARLDDVTGRFERYLGSTGWCAEAAPGIRGIAYLSMEFGLHESLHTYSGGLGVLAGDHLRSASDLGVPLVGVGMLFRSGYFRQLVEDGVQIAAYSTARFERLPLRQCTHDDGEEILLPIPIADGIVQARIWRLDVGRARLYLLDTDHGTNDEQGRRLTHHLYGGDHRMRIAQEILLGVGGVRALRAVGERPALYHLNEGHCAFAVLELLREQRLLGRSAKSAAEWVRHRTVFTTHTPVEAGHDRFGWELVDQALGPWRNSQNLHPGEFIDLGRLRPGTYDDPLNMTVLALRHAGRSNGVSALHGEVSRKMWRALWPGVKVEDVPIGHVTNGVHPVFWASDLAQELFDEVLPGWRERPWDAEVWAPIAHVPDERLWALRNRLRARLVDFVADRTGTRLDPHALTIGFARRFAPYKRGDLAFSDPEVLRFFLERTPAQLVFAGKAHPHDGPGKAIVAEVVKWASDRRFRDRVVFVEDYDIHVGRTLTSGADVWLNNPRRPQEASGTSGQKVPLNGGINLSVLDGWWPEGYDGTNGWAIGGKDDYRDPASHDAADAEALRVILVKEVAPLWRDRDAEGIPRGWLKRVKRSIVTCAPKFNSHRMLRDYVLDFYGPLASQLLSRRS